MFFSFCHPQRSSTSPSRSLPSIIIEQTTALLTRPFYLDALGPASALQRQYFAHSVRPALCEGMNPSDVPVILSASTAQYSCSNL